MLFTKQRLILEEGKKPTTSPQYHPPQGHSGSTETHSKNWNQTLALYAGNSFLPSMPSAQSSLVFHSTCFDPPPYFRPDWCCSKLLLFFCFVFVSGWLWSVHRTAKTLLLTPSLTHTDLCFHSRVQQDPESFFSGHTRHTSAELTKL